MALNLVVALSKASFSATNPASAASLAAWSAFNLLVADSISFSAQSMFD